MPRSAVLRNDPGRVIEPAFVSPREAGRFLSLSLSQVYRLLDDGVIESRRHGTRRLVLLSSLREFALKLPA